ncbi:MULTISPECIES: M15 family metallopeptidase [Paenibacillus]|uniref:D-alanyl-D-alanine carboxypeptidase-like core domain-containing protein n=1 Tax=Paenibacillus vini TaxID=1476024 RepID=A0ABQ4M670_9BACL|nr:MULTISPECIES: M15 family metallopeptidase [Paenibacillus]MDN4066337.1 M15 family metallopeptidase [Paenibacillus vini]GIP51496.1 hypothetical protein J42TS3_05310 [Paenibacillus vini]
MKLRTGWGATTSAVVLVMAAVLFTGCGKDKPADTEPLNQTPGTELNDAGNTGANEGVNGGSGSGTDGNTDNGANGETNTGADQGDTSAAGGGTDSGTAEEGNGAKPDASQSAAADADSVAVLVNKEFALPEDHKPGDLVYPDVRFTFKEKIEKRMMRKEAASALEKLFEGAESDGIYLAGVSAYRSHSTQTSLFNRYVKKDGLEKAKTYSAVPGHSEHETGLAIDVSGSDGKCAAEDCFGDTEEAKWLAEHASEYGFIIRYPEGKDDITGYKYEPWHLRYVGKEIASDIAERDITLEEYYDAVPVANP